LAEKRGEAWPDDAKRPLTDQGMSRVQKGAMGLIRVGVDFDLILTSPLTRTRQTAELIAAQFDLRPHIVSTDALAPGGTFQAVLAELEKHVKRTRIALVGHEPDLGELAARLLGLRRPLEFKKGGACRIDVAEIPPTGPGSLRWFLPPRVLRYLRRQR
jgi:phosphohistidine phosphatase